MRLTPFESYFSQQEKAVRIRLEQIDTYIGTHYPQLKRKISYGMPTFSFEKNVIHFAAMKHHIGLYPGPDAITYYKEDLARWKTSKGAIQVPYAGEFPFELLDKLITYNLDHENQTDQNKKHF